MNVPRRPVLATRSTSVAAAAPSQRDLVALSLLLGPAWRPGATHRRSSR